jgi:hypothetical protein
VHERLAQERAQRQQEYLQKFAKERMEKLRRKFKIFLAPIKHAEPQSLMGRLLNYHIVLEITKIKLIKIKYTSKIK